MAQRLDVIHFVSLLFTRTNEVNWIAMRCHETGRIKVNCFKHSDLMPRISIGGWNDKELGALTSGKRRRNPQPNPNPNPQLQFLAANFEPSSATFITHAHLFPVRASDGAAVILSNFDHSSGHARDRNLFCSFHFMSHYMRPRHTRIFGNFLAFSRPFSSHSPVPASAVWPMPQFDIDVRNVEIFLHWPRAGKAGEKKGK